MPRSVVKFNVGFDAGPDPRAGFSRKLLGEDMENMWRNLCRTEPPAVTSSCGDGPAATGERWNGPHEVQGKERQ